MVDELREVIRDNFECMMVEVHTCFPAVVKKYESKTRRCEILPCLKRKMPDGSFVDYPIIVDVPVRFFGTKKYTVHLPPELNEEVSVHVIERCTDVWRDKGHDGIEDKDPRRFNIQDVYIDLGLQPQEFIAVEEPGLVIKHHTNWDGDFISHVIIDDDKIQAKYKKKCQVTLSDDKIHAITEFCTMEATKKVIKATNSISTMILREDKFSEYNKTQSLYLILRDFMQEFYDHFTVGPPPKHKLSPVDKLKVKILQRRLAALMEA